MGHPVPRENSKEANPKVRDLEKQLKDNLGKWNAERERLVMQIQRLEESARQWDTERRRLNEHAGQLQQAFVQASAKIQTLEVAAREPSSSELKLEELKNQNAEVEQKLEAAQSRWDVERRDMHSQIERLQQQLQRTTDTSGRVSKEVVDQLRQQYEQRLHETTQQKTQLAKELESVNVLLEVERTRLSTGHAPSNGNGAGLSSETINAEIARVETQLSQIMAIIDDPETELATVIRKNVEKAELDSYLKGILFSLGKTHK
jgi:chromosome segregation ATPase